MATLPGFVALHPPVSVSPAQERAYSQLRGAGVLETGVAQ